MNHDMLNRSKSALETASKRVGLVLIVLGVATLALALCPGSQTNYCPEGCTTIHTIVFDACSTDGNNCCQYAMFKKLCVGAGCPEYVVDRVYVATYNNETCNGTTGDCPSFGGGS